MKLNVFTCYDSKAEAYLQPFLMPSKGEAIRAFTATANDDKSNIGKYPADFTLFHIGEYDDQTGTLTNYEIKNNLGCAIEYKKNDVPSHIHAVE